MITLNVTATGSAAGLQRLRRGLEGSAGLSAMHARVATEAKNFIKEHVAKDDGHDTAQRLGAKPTGHMAKIANRIEARSDAEQATIKIPRKSRLRAAFGGFTILPGAGKKFLTIPMNAEAYGKRAGLIPDLFFAQVGPKHTPVLARLRGFSSVRKKGVSGIGAQLEIMYVLRTSVDIKEDRTLLPLDELPEVARRTATAYINELGKGESA